SFQLEGSSASEKVTFGVGEIEALEIGDLKVSHLPTASVPLPVFADFGKKRPELVIGYSLFAAAAIRIDYAKREVVFARDIAALKSPAAKDIALKDFGGKPLAKAEVNRTEAVMDIDTGN